MMASFALGVEVATIGEVLRRAASRKPNALYSVLFVTAAASASDIRKQYRQLARKVRKALCRMFCCLTTYLHVTCYGCTGYSFTLTRTTMHKQQRRLLP